MRDMKNWFWFPARLRINLHFMRGCKAARVDLVEDLMKKGMVK